MQLKRERDVSNTDSADKVLLLEILEVLPLCDRKLATEECRLIVESTKRFSSFGENPK